MTWKEFLTQHWELIVAADFFTIEVWTAKGLQRFMVLFFIELSTRRVEIGGISASANGLWMGQIARNLTDSIDGLLAGKRYLIHDRDPLFTDEFLRTLKDANVKSVKLPARSPNLNAYAERFVRSIKECCLHRLILFGEAPCGQLFRVSWAINIAHAITRAWTIESSSLKPGLGTNTGAVHRRERLGGTLNYYYRAAA